MREDDKREVRKVKTLPNLAAFEILVRTRTIGSGPITEGGELSTPAKNNISFPFLPFIHPHHCPQQANLTHNRLQHRKHRHIESSSCPVPNHQLHL